MMKKINLDEAGFKKAPNRRIAELASAVVLGSETVTCRVVEVNPISSCESRNPHIHLDVEEVIFVLEGRGEIWSEGTVETIEKNDLILIPKQEKHMLFNPFESPLRIICFFPKNNIEETQLICTDIIYP